MSAPRPRVRKNCLTHRKPARKAQPIKLHDQQPEPEQPAIVFVPMLAAGDGKACHDAYERLFEAAHELGFNYSNEHAYSEKAGEQLAELLPAALELAALLGIEAAKPALPAVEGGAT